MRLKRPVILIIAIAIIGGGAFFMFRQQSKVGQVPASSSSLSPAAFQAQKMVLLQRFGQGGAAAAFAYMKQQVAENPSVARDCHPLLHNLGYAAYDKYGSFGAAMAQADEMCNSGYVHGLIEASFARAPDVATAVLTTCPAVAKEDFKQWECYHGIGHGVMMSSGKQLDVSLKDCRTLPTAFGRGACGNGAFMERFITVDHMGMAGHPSSADIGLCRTVAADDKPDCYGYAPTAYLTAHPNQYQSATGWCHDQAGVYVQACIHGIGAQAMKDNSTWPAVSAAVCQEMPIRDRTSCVEGAVGMAMFNGGSSRLAEPLCSGAFTRFATTCRQTLADVARRLDF